MSTTQAVLDHHLQQLASANLDGLMSDYTDDSTLVMADAAYRGRDEIRGFFAQAVEMFAQPGAELVLRQTRVDGDTAIIVWDGDTPQVRVDFATDSFIIRDGKILVQTFAAKMVPKS
jgi:hypothetical protein